MPAPQPRGGELINGRIPSFRNEYEVLDQRLHRYDINSNFHGTLCQHHGDTCAEYTCLSALPRWKYPRSRHPSDTKPAHLGMDRARRRHRPAGAATARASGAAAVIKLSPVGAVIPFVSPQVRMLTGKRPTTVRLWEGKKGARLVSANRAIRSAQPRASRASQVSAAKALSAIQRPGRDPTRYTR